MAVAINVPLPPLRRRIRTHFFFLIALYAVLGLFMVASVFLASGTTPKLIHVNYDSVVATRKMQEAWNALQNPTVHSEKKQETWLEQFEDAITLAEHNITEPGEETITKDIRSLWNEFNKSPSITMADSYSKMNFYFEDLIRINEQGMFKIAEEATSLGRKIFVFSIIFFVVTFFLAILIADGLAGRLARPIKLISGALRNNPALEGTLKLPKPDSLEMRILTSEISALWQRVSTLQKFNIEQLAAERERLETVLTSVEDAILVLDNDERVIQVSEGMLKLLKIDPVTISGQPWNDLSLQNQNYLKLREKLKTDLSTSNSFELQADSATRIYAARVRNIITPTGSKMGRVYLLHDITELRHRDRLRNEFIGVLSHELKTPLQSLGTAAELLKKRISPEDEESNMLVDTVNEDTARIRAVANDFMQMSMVDQHSLKIRLKQVPLSQLLPDWIKPFRVLARDKNIQLDFIQEGSDTIWAKVDTIKLPWAISNLLANAIRVSQDGSKVTVRLSDRSEMIEVDILDEGPGIPPEVQASMFEPYYQAPFSENSGTSGFLGLGLTIAKEVAEAHYGRIEYFARRPHGSTFRISLPYNLNPSGA